MHRTALQDPFKLAGDESTHCIILSEVPVVQILALPKVSPEDKKDIIPSSNEHAVPKNWARSTVPLHWAEVKPVEYYEAVLKISQAGFVIDLQGCAAIAVAAFRLNVQYVGMCFCPKHANWLSNVVDRAIIKCLINTSHPLYAQGLAEFLDKHFADDMEVSDQTYQDQDEDLQLEDE